MESKQMERQKNLLSSVISLWGWAKLPANRKAKIKVALNIFDEVKDVCEANITDVKC